MYTYEKAEPLVLDVGGSDELVVVDRYSIIDSDGTHIAFVLSDDEAEALLSHLNR